ncbi:hypothetical protein SNE40_013689 [Patella caerulea]|uniref:CIP2A N-terminal domain-containing protein n=1 Tax=Patella caerulea TaxID=87958 RepID=A0AAN8PFU8_PATCE
MAANQYFTSSSNSNMVYLQSQLESLQSHTDNLPSLKFFNTRNMLAVDCLTRVVQILNDPQVKMVLANKCIMVFQNLVQDNDLCTLLQSQFHLSESLASVLKNSVEKQSEGFTLECIQLLMTLTYGQQINFHDNHIKYLLKFLVKQICSSASELTQPCLGLLANICRKNITVQTYIRSLECSKLCRALLNFLLDQNKTNVIFSLSVITSVFQHEVLGEKVLSGANLRNTLQLLFNLLINGDAGITRRYAVDVFTDISKSPKILHSLLKYEHLPICLENTLNLLTSSVPDSVAKIFELLIEFSSTSQMRTSICSIMLRCQPLRDLSQLETLLRKPVNQSSYPLLATIHWASQPIEATDTHTASLLAIDLLKEIFEEVLFSDDKNNMSRNHVEVMVCLLIKILRENCQQPVDTSDTKTQEKTTKVLQFLTVLCSDDDVKKLIASQVNVDMFRTILQHQFNQNKHMYQINNSSKNHTASDIDVEVILLSLNLMSKLRRHVINLDDYFKLQLQDSRLVPFLATYITSANRDHVQTALQLVSTAASLDIFLDVVLCDSVATMNVRKEEETAVVVPERTTVLSDISYNKENTNNTILPLTSKHTMSDEDNKTMQNLILKMETNLEMKDSKVSDIIQLYEHQLQSLKTNEEHLENLLKTKSLELVQSDRLISQYRLNGARVESESHNLRKMLQESERKSEEYLEQMNDMRLKLNNLETTVDQLDQENER